MHYSGLSTNETPNANNIVCHECDYLVRLPVLQNKQKALCPRCGYKLTTLHTDAMDKLIAFSLSALLFLLVALPFEFLSFEANGQLSAISIFGGIAVLIEHHYPLLAILVVIATLLLPAAIMLGLLYILLPLKFGYQPAFGQIILNWIFKLLPWSMAEIFLIGVLVSLVKIMTLAQIGIGLSFYAYVLFTLCLVFSLVYLDKHHLEQYLHKPAKIAPSKRREDSVQTTWALLLTAIILYVPANLLPIMHTRLLGTDDPSTIFGGVILLWQHGSYPIAAIIFIASVFVPIFKLVLLGWLNLTVQRSWDKQHKERIFWYRVTEFVGRWSMIDVFVVAILVSLIQLGNTMSIYPGPAVLAFCGVVIVTMLAAMSFDSKLIWKGRNN
jgi:paraquat-inducible protein A